MYNRFGLGRFQKAQAAEPFHVDEARAGEPAGAAQPSSLPGHFAAPQGAHSSSHVSSAHSPGPVMPGKAVPERTPPGHVQPAPSPSATSTAPQTTTVGGGESTWQPPEWAVEPKNASYHLEVSKDGQVVDQIPLRNKRHLFGRQPAMCDYVLDHPSLSRQHAAVVHHKNGSVFVIDLGSVHGTYVSNERLQKDIPVEIEVGQSLRFAASTRTYILRRSTAPAVSTPSQPVLPEGVVLPGPPDPSNADAVLEYNTLMNRLGQPVTGHEGNTPSGTLSKRKREGASGDGEAAGSSGRHKVRFRDESGGMLVEVVGFSDGFHVSTEPGPVGVREGGSLKGQFDSMVQTVVVPRNKGEKGPSGANSPAGKAPEQGTKGPGPPGKGEKSTGVSMRLREYLGKTLGRASEGGKGGLYEGIGEETLPPKAENWNLAASQGFAVVEGREPTKPAAPASGLLGVSDYNDDEEDIDGDIF